MRIRPSAFASFREWLRIAILTLVLFLLVRGLALEAFTIPTSSMENTLQVGDFLFVNKAVYGAPVPGTGLRLPAFREPRAGDVVVFRPPHDPQRNYVKRIVGVGGDTLRMEGKTLWVNGTPLEEGYARHRDRGGDAVHPDMTWQSDFLAAARPPHPYVPSRDNWGPLVVPHGSYFVLGDNRDNSEDSRYWGFVPRQKIMGTPWIVYFSLAPEKREGDPWFQRIRWQRVGETIR